MKMMRYDDDNDENDGDNDENDDGNKDTYIVYCASTYNLPLPTTYPYVYCTC